MGNSLLLCQIYRLIRVWGRRLKIFWSSHIYLRRDTVITPNKKSWIFRNIHHSQIEHPAATFNQILQVDHWQNLNLIWHHWQTMVRYLPTAPSLLTPRENLKNIKLKVFHQKKVSSKLIKQAHLHNFTKIWIEDLRYWLNPSHQKA